MRPLVLAALILAFTPPAFAGDGRIEINQASVDAAGGFPFTINAPGSYVLTSNLTVTTDVTALAILADGVTVDLNGFRISGSSSCAPGSCVQGGASGVTSVPVPSLSFHNVSVYGGEVSHFSGYCIRLGNNSRVERMRVMSCGAYGISISTGIVTGSLVSSVRHDGLFLGEGAIYSHNTVTDTNLAAATGRAVRGGAATAGNYCDDGSCFRVPVRRYYLTSALYNGANAANPGNCAPGFHFATIAEISNPASLRYDTSRSIAPLADSGMGPPAFGAWIRTGSNAVSGSNTPGIANCSGWTSTSGFGTRVGSAGDMSEAAERSSPWSASTIGAQCGSSTAIICIED